MYHEVNNQSLIKFLNQLLSNYFVLYVKLRRYHWFVKGDHFFVLHEKFKEMYHSTAKDIDNLAERILMIKGKPFATMIKYLKEATIEEATADDEEHEIIAQLQKDCNQLIKEIKTTGIPLAKKNEDDPTVHLLSIFLKTLEKYQWMFLVYQDK